MSAQPPVSGKLQDEILGLAESITHIIESFRKLHNPLAESAEYVPKATEQLDKISQQTEQAAHKMLDRIEQITMREDQILGELKKIAHLTDGKHAAELTGVIDAISQMVTQNRDDAYQIMDALQFQDITAQQMNHAAALLEEIEGKLKFIGVVMKGESFEMPESPGASRRERAYDPHAEFVDKQAHQKDIDSMFASKKK